MQTQSQFIALERTVVAALAALAAYGLTACFIEDYRPHQVYARGLRWLARRQVPSDSEEPAGEPWPAAGHPGPPQCRPLNTIAELLTWQPPSPPTAGCSTDTPINTVAIAAVDAQSNNLPQRRRQGETQHHASAPSTRQQQPAVQQSSLCLADLCCSEVPLHLSTRHVNSSLGQFRQQQPQLLVCHDMMGGYLPQDALISGSNDHRHYRIWHWDCIDVFVYFSHHMVAIPPKGWIHAAHKHGVKVLGTFITEFGQGRHRCNRLFHSNASAQQVADQLVAVAAHYGFEGWLVNIENSLSQHQVNVMKHFVGYLRSRMAATDNNSMIVWYDAVTTAGELRWQNKLSPLNAPFFDLADALFVNYTWKSETLAETITASAARHTDVYMGVDVHGRGSYGGGGHYVGVALHAAASAGLSAALFAPGWVYENLDGQKFVELQEQWWTKVQQSWGYSHPVVHTLPFTTSFNAGAGRGWFENGQLVADGASAGAAAAARVMRQEQQQETVKDSPTGTGWFNMVLTDTLPTSRDPFTQQVISDPIAGRLTSSTAFNGGSCLVICSSHKAAAGSVSDRDTDPAAVDASTTGPAAALPPAATAAPTVEVSGGFSPQQAPPCCWLRSAAGSTAIGGTEVGAGPCSNMAMLQLFSAEIVMPHEMQLAISWVYAACRTESSRKAELQEQQQQRHDVTAPYLWVMTQQGSRVPAAPAQQRAVHILGASAESGQLQRQLQLANGQDSGIAVHDVSVVAQKQWTEECLGPLQFVAMDECMGPVNSTTSSRNQFQSSPTALSVDSMWDVDLRDSLRGHEWRRRTVQLSLRAGSVITGIGVAVSVANCLGASCAGGVLVHALLGQIQLKTVSVVL